MRELTAFPTRVGPEMRRIPLCLLLSLVLCSIGGALAWSAAPVIEDVQIDRGRDTDAPDWACYHQRVIVLVSDADGAADIASVTITDPAPGGEPHTVTPDGGGSWWEEDANTIGCEWSQWGLLSAPSAGTYTIAAADAGANEDTLTTPPAPAVSDTHPEVVAPVMEAIIYDSTPTFEWTAGLAGSSYHIDLEEEGTLGAIWSADVAGTQCDYDFDASASRASLLPSYSYFWQVTSSRMEDDRVTNPLEAISTSQKTRGRFTIAGGWPGTPPELPGKFAYAITFWAVDGWNWGMSSIMGYNTDPASRTWVGSDFSSSPDWSPDGTKLLYAKSGAMWIDSLDGNLPVEIPETHGWGDCRWASDASRVVYAVAGPPSPYTPWNDDIWVSNIDGTNQYPLVECIESQDRYPEWSPDGLWIAYRKLPDAEGVGMHLVRYDGTDDHALLPAGVVGYPGYSVGYMGEHAWSPDGKKLAVLFQASSAVDDISGIGVISRDGGEITPAFVAPPGVICCAQPHLPKWSPDSTQVVFTSGHHLSAPDLPVDLQWIPTPELWLANADGSGEPVRLTYDHGFNNCVAWWDENTNTGTGIEVVKGDTTVTFDEVTETGNTSVTVYEEPIGLPVHYEFAEDYYEVSTTAEIAGPISICMTYRDEDIPSGVAEEDLAILHYVEEGDYWEDITVSRDLESNIVCGESDSLSVFVLSAAPPGHFRDVLSTGLGSGSTESHWAFDEIEACVVAGIVSGYPNGYYRPEWIITRDQMAVFIARALAGATIPAGPEEPTFPDVQADHWAYDKIEYAAANNIVEGYPNGTYHPEYELGRGQMAVFIARAIVTPIGEAGLESYQPPETPTFEDVPVDYWCYRHVEYLAAEDLVSGYPDGNYYPIRRVSRDQMAVFITRAFELPL